MKTHKLSLLLLSTLVLFLTFSCDDDVTLISSQYDYKSGDEFDVHITMNDNTGDVSQVLDIIDLPNRTEEFYVRLTFSSDDKEMERLYANQSIAGAATKAKKLSDGLIDGSLTIDKHDQDNFDLVIPFPVLSSADINDGESVVYKIWTTHGAGEYDNPNHNLEIGVATLTVNY